MDEPKATTTRVLRYNLAHVFNIQDFEGLPLGRVRGNSEQLFAMDKNLYRADEFLQKFKRCKV